MLLIHSKYLKYKPMRKALKYVKDVERKEVKVDNALVVFLCAEKRDEKNIEKVVQKSIEEIKSKFNEVKAENIVLYPYAHLSSDLAKPYVADRILREMEKKLKEEKIPVYASPFGWYKEFQIHCLGHPLAEAFKEIVIEEKKKREEVVSRALKEEEKIVSHWFILKPDGEMIPIEVKDGELLAKGDIDLKKHENLAKFARYEIAKSREVKEMPPHIPLMKELEIADYEEVSDSGNLRFYPKGRLIKSLIEEFVTQKVIEFGGMEVETPLMYSVEHPAAIGYLNKFPARQYILKSGDREFFLRFSACFGQFCMADDMTISYKDLPLWLYELTRYSFRRERKSELAGLRRLRAFTMPDVHAFCKDIQQAMEEFKKRFRMCQEVLGGIGFKRDDYELAIRFTREFYEKNKEFIMMLVKLHGRPALVEMWEKRAFYFILKYEFNFVDALDKAAALSTDQIDIENGERYNITYIDEKGKKRHPIILHCSPSGAIERDMYALLEKAYLDQKAGRVPSLPLWLAPIQVRIIPVSDEYLEFSKELMKTLENRMIRVDLDDRSMTVEKRVREAEIEWVPFILVVGKREIESKKLNVRIREENSKEVVMGLDELISMIHKKVMNRPFKPLSLPKFLSKRPRFVG